MKPASRPSNPAPVNASYSNARGTGSGTPGNNQYVYQVQSTRGPTKLENSKFASAPMSSSSAPSWKQKQSYGGGGGGTVGVVVRND